MSTRDGIATACLLLILGVCMTALVLLTSTGPASTPNKVPEWDKIPVRPIEGSIPA